MDALNGWDALSELLTSAQERSSYVAPELDVQTDLAPAAVSDSVASPMALKTGELNIVEHLHSTKKAAGVIADDDGTVCIKPATGRPALFETDDWRPIVLGVLIELCSCVGSNLGLVLEKQALMAEQERLGTADISATKLPLWWLGFVIFAAAQVVSGIALTMISVVITAPLGSFSLVVNVFSSTLYLKEHLSTTTLVSSLAIVLGCVLTTIFAPWSKASSSLECFRVYVSTTDFHIVAAILLSALAVVFGAGRLLVLSSQRRTTDQSEWPRSARIGRFFYPIAAGMTAVWTINSGAALMRVWGFSFQHTEVYKSFEIYVLLVLYVFLCVFWQRQINESMIVLNASVVIPINFALFTMLTFPVSGALHGSLDNWHPDAFTWSTYCFGTACAILGMCGLMAEEGSGENRPASEPPVKPQRLFDDDTDLALGNKQAAMQEKGTPTPPSIAEPSLA